MTRVETGRRWPWPHGFIGLTMFWSCLLPALLPVAVSSADKLPIREEEATQGRFLRLYWFEHGVEHGNPTSKFNRRFRVNAPDVMLHPRYGGHPEAKASGMMQLLMEEDLRLLAGAELYLELWGGHPGTGNKRVTLNGRTTYPMPKTGAEDNHCTHLYPTIPLELTDLVNGYNVLQFACDQGKSFWGHFIVDNACLRAVLKNDHPDLKKAGLANFQATVQANPIGEKIELVLFVPEDKQAAIASVDFQGSYEGYDENGDTQTRDWHGFTKRCQAVAFLGTAAKAPFTATWDLSLLPAQKDLAVRAVVRFKDQPNLIYVTPATRGLHTPEPRTAQVAIVTSKDLPQPFWSRAGRKKSCTIDLDVDPSQIEQAELHILVWDGGAGTVKDYFTLNGHALSVAGTGKHDVIYSKRKLDRQTLKRGTNRFELLSDTEHHGIEILLPGPALIVRSRK